MLTAVYWIIGSVDPSMLEVLDVLTPVYWSVGSVEPSILECWEC